MRISLKLLIITHISYREVFKAPISINDLKKYIGINETSLPLFEQELSDLKMKQLVEEKNGYLVSFGNGKFVDEQPEKIRFTKELIKKGERFLGIFSMLPFVKFIGVSGSLAADNPTLDSSGPNKGTVDMDLFVISTRNTLWILFLIERIITNIQRVLHKHHFYCFNYVTDETFLEIHNKNFYTATEIVNMKTVYDSGIYDQFKLNNSWYKKYYNCSEETSIELFSQKKNLLFVLLAPVNFLCFVFFCIGRAIKRFEIEPITEIGYDFNPIQKSNLKRLSNSNGGYQEAIKKRFEEVLKLRFHKDYSKELVSILFPENGSFHFSKDNIYDLEFDRKFEKYT